MRKYNRANCTNSVRAVIKDGNTTITLHGRYANEWSILKSENGILVMTTYPNRIAASKDWKELLKAHK